MNLVVPAGFRVAFISIFLLALGISGFFRRRARAESETIPRRREGSFALLARLSMALPVLGSILLYTFAPRWMTWASVPVPAWVRWIGVFLGLVCLPFLAWVLQSIGENISETVLTKSEHRLVTSGPYRWVRHPLYSAGLLLILGLALIAGSWFMAVLWLIGVVVFRWIVIPAEEDNLISKFGDGYREYRARTGALVPRIP